MHVLVTGSEGFIGSHLTECLVRRKHAVTAFVMYNSAGSTGWLDDLSADVRDRVRVVMGDVRDLSTVVEAARNVDAIAHLAALISVPYSFRAAPSYIQTNTMGTLNVLEAARSSGVGRTLIMSTSEVYGTAQAVPMGEDHPLRAQSPYAASKTGADKLAESFAHGHGLDVVIARPFNVYGPRQSTRAVLGTVLDQVTRGARNLTLGYVSARRDLTFVEDTVEALARLVEAPGHYSADAFNIASGTSYSIRELVAAISEILGQDLTITSDPDRYRVGESEVQHLEGSSAKITAATGWRPKWTLHEGLAASLDWWTSAARITHPAT